MDPYRDGALRQLAAMINGAARLVVITGAGCSTGSGIPEYRDDAGRWKGADPMLYEDFVADAMSRKRYWARSLNGFERIAGAQPNPAHRALAELEARGHVDSLITQNVDGLHGRAGSKRVLELHGGLERVVCLQCRAAYDRGNLQTRLQAANPGWTELVGALRPDGDAELGIEDYASFIVPDCDRCAGMLKPDVVFFGEPVPRARAAQAMQSVCEADALLVVGSSLTALSGFRLVREASRRGIRIAAINRGTTRADQLLTMKVDSTCEDALSELVRQLGGAAAGLNP